MSNQPSSESRMFLTSAGVNTETLKHELREQLDTARKVRILRLADGWQPIGPGQGLSPRERSKHLSEAGWLKLWSKHWLHYSFGHNHEVNTRVGSELSESKFNQALLGADVLLIPGGNTYLTALRLSKHRDTIRQKVLSGDLLLLSEGAGSIYAGNSLNPASIDPADPSPTSLDGTSPLEVFDSQIIVHASGRQAGFATVIGKMAARELRRYESSQAALDSYFLSSGAGAGYVCLNDAQALKVNGSQALVVGERLNSSFQVGQT